MTKIDQIWNDLENDKSLSRGLLLRRYSASSLPDVYVALQQPEGLRCVALKIHGDNDLNTLRYSNLKDIHVTVVPDDNDNTGRFLLIVLANNEYNEVFATLAEDLINQITSIADEERLLKEVLNRFEKWKALFDKATSEGLTPEEQRGLYGELYFMRKWVSESPDLQKCVQSWLGPEKGLRDFQSDGWGIEIKTTFGNNHQKIHISSERQLDTTNLSILILYHLSLESQQGNGETLNQIVGSITESLSQDVSAQLQFRSKLLQGGYFFHHAFRYDLTGYQIRQELFYRVRDNFPRIEEVDIRAGIGDVKYSIMLSEQSEYLVPETFVFETIN